MQKNPNKKYRIASAISRNISDIILFELKNSVFKLVSVNQVSVSNDNSFAKIYVSHLDARKIDEAVEELNAKKGLIRSLLAKKMDIYKVPELLFIKDDTYDKGEKIEAIIRDLNIKDED